MQDLVLPTPEEARELCWNKGLLSFKLDDNQIQLKDSYLHAKNKVAVWSCSRRLGKSYTLCVLAVELCLNKKNAIVKFLSPTQKMVRSIIRPLMRQIIADCPVELRPVENSTEGVWKFPSTGAQIQIAGCDGGRADSIRGGSADLCLVDEAGFVDDLEYIVNSILLPTTLTTKGKIILASTPPTTPTHDFVLFLNKAKEDGSFVRKTIFDNPRLTPSDIAEMAASVGGMGTVAWRREYMAEVIKDDQYAIVPEFTEELKNKIVREWKKPAFCDYYVSMDVGMTDLTVVLFAYYDFKADKVIIEDEYVVTGTEFTTKVLADNIVIKERIHFKDPITLEVREPYKRVSDNNNLLINDLYLMHRLIFHATEKKDADAALNNMRILISAERLIINPRCITLISHLESGIWNKNKTSFARSTSHYGHFDAIDSLKYLIRNIELGRNPYPANYGMPQGQGAFFLNPGKKNPNDQSDVLKRMLNLRNKK